MLGIYAKGILAEYNLGTLSKDHMGSSHNANKSINGTKNNTISCDKYLFTGAQPKAGSGYKMQTVSIVFSMLHC